MLGNPNLGWSIVYQGILLVKPELLGIPFLFSTKDVKIVRCGVTEVLEAARIRTLAFDGIAAQVMLVFGE